MIEAIIFDAGGVLHSYDGFLVQQEIISGLRISPDQFKQVWLPLTLRLELGQISEENYWQEFKRLTDSKVELPEESLLLKGLIPNFNLHQEVIEMVDKMKDLTLKTAVLSNTVPPHGEFTRNLGVYSHFDEVVLSYEVGMRKPNPEIYNLVVSRLKINPEKGIFIDDRVENVEGAKRVGLNGLLFTTADKLREDLEGFGINI